MKSKWNVVATMIAFCLIASASHAQGGSLKVRFRVPFPFTVENKTFAAGVYEVTQPGQLMLGLRNVGNQASAFEHVQPAGSSNVADGHARAIFHRYGKSYFLVTISDGSWLSSYDFDRSSSEQELARKSMTREEEVVRVLSNGTVETADTGRK